MFGYVVAHKPELKMKEFYKYKAYYCGFCHVLKDKYGLVGQMTLSYDMTFLIMLLTSLYECPTTHQKLSCRVHPIKKQDMLWDEITGYAADMNMLLTYHHLMDDWQDEKKHLSYVGAMALKKTCQKLTRKYPRQSRQIVRSLKELHQLEVQNETSVDRVAGCFGRLMEEIFVYRRDGWEQSLRRIGFYLGKFIYIMDAYDDLEEDLKSGSYNSLKNLKNHENFTKECNFMLNLMMAECTIEFEKLPCIEDGEILRNILYAGVWTRFDAKQKEHMQEKREEQ